jgi:putative ABC transport system ATP-binding protein
MMLADLDDIAVHCQGVTHTYGTGDAQVIALRGVDVDVRRGELLMLVGPSGCGKTTLISVIAAILDQDSGNCEVLGRDLQEMDQSDRAHFRGHPLAFSFRSSICCLPLRRLKTSLYRF